MHLPRCSLESSERSASSEIPCLRLAAADGEGQWQRWEESGWPRDPHDLNDGVTGDVQRALNATKKAEHRLGRLMQDREKATLQWQEYAKASKAAYYKEKERYMKALQNYDRDIHEAQAAQNEARRALRDQVAGVYKSEQVPHPEACFCRPSCPGSSLRIPNGRMASRFCLESVAQGLVMWSAIWCMLGSLFDTKARLLVLGPLTRVHR